MTVDTRPAPAGSPPPLAAPSMRNRHGRRLAGALARQVTMLAAALAFAIPLIWLLLAPTKSRAELSERAPLAFGDLRNVGNAWSNLISYGDGIFGAWIVNSLLYAAASVVVALLTCVPAGYAMAMYVFRGRKIVLIGTLIMMLVPAAALVLPLFLEMAALDLVDTAWSVILPLGLFPFGVYLAFLYYQANLPLELVEAGRLDGCSEARLFWSIGLPLGRPAVGVVGFFAFIQAWNNYFLPFVMFSDDRNYNLQLGLGSLISSTGAINASRGASNLPIHGPEVALAAVITAAPILLVFVFAQRYLVAGQVSGSVKG
ncbi:MAG TPA: carbohydrate ABC transporter permease [Pseudonocardia sp.]|nr:carbohydrate ABC transporter permease [Pseudonocardia sp.]